MERKLGVGLVGVASLVCISLCGMPAFAKAKHYQPIRVDLGLDFPWSPGLDAEGLGLVVDGKYLLTDRLSLGLRLTAAFQTERVQPTDPTHTLAVGTVLAKAEYFFSTAQTRPFVGLGAGLYALGHMAPSDDRLSGDGDYFGLMPQVGIDFGFVRVAASYDAIFGVPARARSASPDFLALEISFRIGGARREVLTATPVD